MKTILYLIKKNYELWTYNETHLKVMVKNPIMAGRINRLLGRPYPKGTRFKLGDEPVFKFHIKDISRVSVLIGLKSNLLEPIQGSKAKDETLGA